MVEGRGMRSEDTPPSDSEIDASESTTDISILLLICV